MQVFKKITPLRAKIKKEKKFGQEIGFVPTMGYLHQGHLALLEQARVENDIVVLSIFVNPTQFGPDEDLEEYPRDIERDLKLAEKAGCDLVFIPEADEIYSPQAATKVIVEDLTNKLCGASRAGHFAGVCTIVTKLFNITLPNRAYFGQKDAQQVLVIKRLVKDLNFDLEIKTVDIVREADGLAVSSRNKYLNSKERQAGLILSNSLNLAEQLIKAGARDAEFVKEKIKEKIANQPLAEIDYVEIVAQNSLKTVEKISGKILIALAVYIGETRLIDNLMMEV